MGRPVCRSVCRNGLVGLVIKEEFFPMPQSYSGYNGLGWHGLVRASA